MRFGAVMAGGGVAAVWLLLVGLLAGSTRSYVWLTLIASFFAALSALALGRFGDRGAAVGISVVTAIGLGVAMTVTAVTWITSGWPL